MADLLQTVAPQFDAHAQRAMWLELAAAQLDGAAWGAQYGYAVALLAAHLMTITDAEQAAAGSGGSSGPITSKRAGDLAITYGTVQSSSAMDGALGETSFGRLFIHLRNSRAAGHARVVVPS